MSSEVFFLPLPDNTPAPAMAEAVGRIYEAVGGPTLITENDFVAIKLQVGELHNDTYVPPTVYKVLGDKIKAQQGKECTAPEKNACQTKIPSLGTFLIHCFIITGFVACTFAQVRLAAAQEAESATNTQEAITDPRPWVIQNCSKPFISIAGDGRQLLGVSQGNIMTSTDNGASWTGRPINTDTYLTFVAWTGSMFLAAGSSVILTSPDGRDWKQCHVKGSINSIAWNGKRFVAVGWLSASWASFDGEDWIKSTLPLQASASSTQVMLNYNSVKWAGNQFIVVGALGLILTSPTGEVWTFVENTGTRVTLHDVAWSGEKYVAVGDDGVTLSSTDGVKWKFSQAPLSVGLHSVIYVRGKFLAVGYDDCVYSSSDGVHWSSRKLGNGKNRIITQAGKQIVVLGDDNALTLSLDGKQWKIVRTAKNLFKPDTILSSKERFLTSYNGSNYTSADGVHWTQAPKEAMGMDVYGDRSNLAWTGSQYIRAYGNSSINISTDGVDWEKRKTADFLQMSGILWTGSLCLIVGPDGIQSSVDLKSWTMRLPYFRCASVAWSGSHFAVTGWDGTAACSEDGLSWQQIQLPVKEAFTKVVWTGTQYVAVGYGQKIATSPDGRSWTLHDSGTTGGLYDLFWDGTECIAVGYRGIILTSADGICWRRCESGTRKDLGRIVATDKVLLVTGMDGLILTSPR